MLTWLDLPDRIKLPRPKELCFAPTKLHSRPSEVCSCSLRPPRDLASSPPSKFLLLLERILRLNGSNGKSSTINGISDADGDLENGCLPFCGRRNEPYGNRQKRLLGFKREVSTLRGCSLQLSSLAAESQSVDFPGGIFVRSFRSASSKLQDGARADPRRRPA